MANKELDQGAITRSIFDHLGLVRSVSGKRTLKQYSLAGTKEQAQIERRQVISELVGNTGAIDSKINVGQLFERWLHFIKARVSPRTHERYAEIARRNLGPLIGQIP